MSLQSLIKDALKCQDLKNVANKLSYVNLEVLSSRVEAVIDNPYLTLDKAFYDFNYSTPEFIRKLCAVLEIPTLLCNKVIEEIQQELEIRKQAFKSYIFIETNFERTREPIFVLAASEGFRNIAVDPNIRIKSLNEQVQRIQKIIKAHYTKQTTLQTWGEIKQYVYFYAKETILIFSPQGECVQVVNEYSHAKAKLILDGNEFSGFQP